MDYTQSFKLFCNHYRTIPNWFYFLTPIKKYEMLEKLLNEYTEKLSILQKNFLCESEIYDQNYFKNYE